MSKFTPRNLIELGIGYLPEDVHRFGVAEDLSIADNAALKQYIVDDAFRRGPLFNHKRLHEHATLVVDRYDVRTPDIVVDASSLSGGNLHKLVLGRELARDPLLLIASQPTKGLDIAATEYMYQQLLQQRRQGRAVVLISDNLDEVLQLSDKVAVMYAGRILACIPAEEADRDEIGLLMGGAIRAN